MSVPVPLVAQFQHYAWGDTRFIPALFGLEAKGDPHAEAWLGAHPALPALAVVDSEEMPLTELLSEQPEAVMGQRVAAKYGSLPYLLKILAAERPLSIQVHPSRSQAVCGFARENKAEIALDASCRNYRDPNHKPELIVALEPFYALCGFQPAEEISARLRAAREVAELLPDFSGDSESLRSLIARYHSLSSEVLVPALSAWIARLSASGALGPETAEHWVLRAHREFSTAGSPDRGLFLMVLLNLVRLSPGEGLFLQAGVPHAYLQGRGIEVMASSDNVLRGGLTPKHVDVEEFDRVVRFDCRQAEIVRPSPGDFAGEYRYRTPVEEFELSLIELDREVPPAVRKSDGPEVLLVLEASEGLRVHTGGHCLELGIGQSCLVPHGVEYRFQTRGEARIVRVVVPEESPVPDFRGRQPARLRFGTSGLRGLVNEITDLEAYINTQGFLDYLLETGDALPGTRVALAGDLRPSTDSSERSILRAVARAVQDAGYVVEHVGRIPTPALTYHAVQARRPSVMVTGSHIPFDRNGIKFNRSDGEVSKSDEEGIMEAVARVRRKEYLRDAAESLFDDDGMFHSGRAPSLPPPDDEARRSYVKRYLDFFPPNALQGARLVLYEHTAVGRDIMAEVLRGLGAEVFPMGRTESFVAIDTEDISEQRLVILQDLADRARDGWGPVDAIVSTDGDSDRPMLVAVGQERCVQFLGGDLLGMVTADYLGADAIAVPVSATDAIEEYFGSRGVTVRRTRIGSPWVIAAMHALPGSRRVGWESNGGFLVGSTVQFEGRLLRPLATRDAVLPIVACLHASRRAGLSLAELFGRLPPRFGRAGLLDQVPEEQSHRLLLWLLPRDPSIAEVRFEQGPTVRCIDVDGNERTTSEKAARHLLRTRAALERHFTAERGFGHIVHINFTDGVRMKFDSTEIAHVRASGNAPQLRLYTVAASPARADAIVREGLAESGMLRGLLKEASLAANGGPG